MEYKRNLRIGVDNYTDNETVFVTHGNIGIGTTSSTSKLTVVGDGYFTGILTANRIVSEVYGEFTGGDVSADNIVGTALSISGISTFTSGPVFIGTGTSTGTEDQKLQVTGGAYVSGNLGIGTTNPTSKLTVGGDVNVSGVITATKLIAEVINQTTILSDVSGDGLTFYTGRAPVGVGTTSPFWTIRRTLSSSAGIVTSTGIARDIAWSNRTSGIYT